MDCLWIGIDIGSTTVKTAVVDPVSTTLLFSRYARHNGSPVSAVLPLLDEIAQQFPHRKIRVAFTGSQSSSLAAACSAPFIQEVIAGTIAVAARHSGIRTVVELGGQDAKIVLFSKDGSNTVSDMRMNGVCAGGTGAFIDQMATLLSMPVEEFGASAARGTRVHDVSGRCGVFAKTDIQPLINQGVPRDDIALSCLHALVKQTIGGLAQGMTIEAPVLFAGGPLSFSPVLRSIFLERLGLTHDQAVLPSGAETFIAEGTALSLGSALAKQAVIQPLSRLIDSLRAYAKKAETPVESFTEPFFRTEREREQFHLRHAIERFTPRDYPAGSTVPLYLGIDAGSTTTKFVAIEEDGSVAWCFYNRNNGDPVATAQRGLLDFFEYYASRGVTIDVRGVGTTGYGEKLLAAALGADYHTVETIAHKEAAVAFDPEVSFILDLGGQDMKAIFVKNGVITNIVLNEACSAGCGSFVESYARSLGVEPVDIAGMAFASQHPSELGSRCTVFMNSSIISEQKQGRTVNDILAGLCTSIIENLFTKVVRVPDFSHLGSHVVVQGGTFRNDAVLRAFEQYTGCTAVRPQFAGEMGALGVALLTLQEMQDRAASGRACQSDFIGRGALASLSYTVTEGDTCTFCANRCARRIVRFTSGSASVTGNRCDRGAVFGTVSDPGVASRLRELTAQQKRAVDSVAEMNRLLFAQPSKNSHGGKYTIGLPRVLDLYDSMPFWSTFFAEIGCSVVVSSESSAPLFEKGLRHVASDTVCLPGKIVHGHIDDLLDKKVTDIFMPMTLHAMRENESADGGFHCAVVQGYAGVVKTGDAVSFPPGIRYLSPAFRWTNADDRERQCVDFAVESFEVSPKAARRAVARGVAAQKRMRTELQKTGAAVLDSLRQHGGFGVVLAGRPYHADPFVSHAVAGHFTRLGIPVLCNEAIPGLDEIPLDFSRIDTLNTFHTRSLAAARFVADHPELELVQLVSFGCGHDAILTDEIGRIVREHSGKEVLTLKIDEGDIAGPLAIRITSFVETVKSRRRREESRAAVAHVDPYGIRFEKDHRREKTILIPTLTPEFAALIATCFQDQGYRTHVLPVAGRDAIALGKRHVHNDICFPAQINIGELLDYLVKHPEEVDHCAIGLTKNCDDCRAGHYAALARKALDEAGYSGVPIITTDFGDRSGIHPGLEINELRFKLLFSRGIVLLDALDDMVRKTRPYERVPGTTDDLRRQAVPRLMRALRKNFRSALTEMERIIQLFNAVDVVRLHRRPRVGIIGEIMVNFHETGNYRTVDYLEANGMEAVLPSMIDFFRQDAYNLAEMARRNHVRNRIGHRVMGGVMDVVFNRMIAAVDRRMQRFRWYEPHSDIHVLARNASTVMDTAYRTGEGWLIPGEIISWINSGISAFLIVQPFGCLPNHISGRGVMKAIKEQYPHVSMLPLDFDPDTSIANIHNRLQMIILNASRADEASR